jgi:threonine dehydratase
MYPSTPISKHELTVFASPSFAELYNIIARTGVPPESSDARTVTEYLYRRDSSGNRSRIMLSFNVLEGSSPAQDIQTVLAALNNPDSSNEIRAEDISGNRLAKNHVRYMIGGTEIIPNERIFRFGRCDRYSMELTLIFS